MRRPTIKRPQTNASENGDDLEMCPCKCSVHLFGRNYIPRKKDNYTASKRLQHLSNPRSVSRKHQPKPVEKYERCIEVVREDATSTRLKQLSIPKVRKLISNRDDIKDHVPKHWSDRFDKLIKKSMFSMYSRLGNVQMPPPDQKTKAWTQADWDRHEEWLKVRAQPKKEFKIVPEKSKQVPLEDLMQTMVHLSKPRNVRQKYTYEVNPLAVPFVKKEVVHVVKKNGVLCFKRRHFKKFEIQKSTLSPEKPEWSERVQLLATPKNPRLQKGPTPESSETRLRKPIDPTQKQLEKSILLSTVTRAQPEVFDTPKPISKFALKAKTTEYTAKLAKPREIEQEKDRSFPLKISKHALKAQIKDRTLELSKPNKPISTKFKEIPAEDFYEVKESAKNYVATQQIIVLSKPKLPITKKVQVGQ